MYAKSHHYGPQSPAHISRTSFWGIVFYVRNTLAPIMENQMEKKMENEMKMGIIWWFIRIRALYEP